MDIWNYFKDPAEKKIIQRKIANKIFQNVSVYNENLNLRRQRLQNVLSEDENQIKEELKQYEKIKMQCMVDKQCEELRVLEEQKNKEQEEILAKKLIQLDMVKCKDIQNLIRKRRELEAYEIQRKQILEHQKQKENSKEIDKMWYLKMLGDAEKNKELERNKTLDKMRKEAEMKEFLNAQMLISKEIKNKEKVENTQEVIKIVEDCEKRSISRYEKEVQIINEKKNKLAEDLKKQIVDKQERKKMEKESEISIERKISETALKKVEEINKQKQMEMENRRRELELFGQHFLAVKQEREARERAKDELIAEEAKKRIEDNDRRRQLEAKRSVELLKEALTIRESQLLEKKKEIEKAVSLSCEEVEKRKLSERLIKDEELRKKRESIKAKNQYKSFLEDQMRYSKLAKETQKKQTLLEIKEKEQEEKEFNKRMLELMKRDFDTEQTHPFVQSNISNESLRLDTPYAKY